MYGRQAGLVIQQETAPMSPDSYPSLFCQKDQSVGSDIKIQGANYNREDGSS